MRICGAILISLSFLSSSCDWGSRKKPASIIPGRVVQSPSAGDAAGRAKDLIYEIEGDVDEVKDAEVKLGEQINEHENHIKDLLTQNAQLQKSWVSLKTSYEDLVVKLDVSMQSVEDAKAEALRAQEVAKIKDQEAESRKAREIALEGEINNISGDLAVANHDLSKAEGKIKNLKVYRLIVLGTVALIALVLVFRCVAPQLFAVALKFIRPF